MDNIAYEYVFINNFDVEVFNNGPNTDNDLLVIVENCANTITEVLYNNPGIQKFSSFVTYNTNAYMVTVIRG